MWQIVAGDESFDGFICMFFIIGFAIGIPQWLLLRRYFSNSSI
jgi:hypothetical protein